MNVLPPRSIRLPMRGRSRRSADFSSGRWASFLRWSFLELVKRSGPASQEIQIVFVFVNSRVPAAPSSRPKPGTFHTSEWQTRIGSDHRIDENHSRFQVRREEFLFLGIIRPRAGCETERTVVCHLDRLGCIAYAKNRGDRTEDFLAVSWRFLGHMAVRTVGS